MPERPEVAGPEHVLRRIDASIQVHEALKGKVDLLRGLASIWVQALARGNQILFFGNGGSAADAQHWACELSGRFYLERKPIAAQALTVNTSAMTAIANDYSYDEVFARQLEATGRAGDVAVAISTSGNARSVLRAAVKARELGLVTMGFTGRGGGALRSEVDHWLAIDSDDTPRIQEGHELVGHILCELTEQALFGGGTS